MNSTPAHSTTDSRDISFESARAIATSAAAKPAVKINATTTEAALARMSARPVSLRASQPANAKQAIPRPLKMIPTMTPM